MHSFIAVVVPENVTRGTAQPYVDKILAPYDEETPGEGWWDWYQIGGRWTGVWGEYDPQKDPRNQGVCHLCEGTGVRKDMVVANGCNGCAGSGTEIAWPTQWADFDGDVISGRAFVDHVINGPLMRPLRLVADGGDVVEIEPYWGEKDEQSEMIFKAAMEELMERHPNSAVVVVDIHS